MHTSTLFWCTCIRGTKPHLGCKKQAAVCQVEEGAPVHLPCPPLLAPALGFIVWMYGRQCRRASSRKQIVITYGGQSRPLLPGRSGSH